MEIKIFDNYSDIMKERAEKALQNLIHTALEEDGDDLTSEGVFSKNHISAVEIIAKEDSFVVGLPLIPLILNKLLSENDYKFKTFVKEGKRVHKKTKLCSISAPTAILLKAERVILNFITHLSGVANLTYLYVEELEGTGVALLDTRKTLPGMRFLEKYAVLCAGGKNHRLALDDMLMLKDNHIDAAGSITKAVQALRNAYEDCPPIEVECRTISDVLEAVKNKPERIMLDNMPLELLEEALLMIPSDIEAEISGNVSLENIRSYALVSNKRKPDFISVGKITHSAPTADFSMVFIDEKI